MARWSARAYGRAMIEAVLFDLDQTLFDRKSSLDAFLRDQWEQFSSGLGDAPMDAWRSRFLVLDNQGLVPKSKVYPQILADFGGDPAISDALLTDFYARSCEFARGFPGMEMTLVALRASGLKVGIVTNGETDFQSRNIVALGLNDLVDEVLISQSEGLRKPDRLMFLRAAERLGVEVSNCLFVGDNPVADILGASAAGMRTAWFYPGLEWPGDIAPMPGAKIDALTEVLVLAGINSK